ncbi:MAG: hypothetical protein DCC75_02470, partial [Proteobacteria bacterium]
EDYNLFNGDQCFFDPTDSDGNRVLVKTVDGLIKSSNLQSAEPAWSQATSGMEAITVQGMARAQNDAADSVAIVTNAGLAFSQNFSSENRVWAFPRCNGRKTCWSYSIAIDPNNPDIVFSGTEDIELGRLSTDDDGAVQTDWRLLLDNPSGATDGDDLPVDLKFRVFKAIPNKVFGVFAWNTSSESFNGGIYPISYSSTPSDTTTVHHPVVLAGKPVNDLIALDESVMYASVPARAGVTNPGIYRLTIQQDESISAELVASSALAGDAGNSIFVYDQNRDLLMAASNSHFYTLSSAASGAGAWLGQSYGTDPGATALAVDQETGRIFRSISNRIYVSDDLGSIWSVFFTGLNDETFHVLLPSSVASSTAARISKPLAQASVLGGSALGLSRISQSNNIPSNCSIIVGKSCAGKSISPGQECSITVNLKNRNTKKGISGKSFALQRKLGSSTWSRFKSGKTLKGGAKTINFQVKKSASYRAVFNSDSISCTSSAKNIRVKIRT